MPQLIFIDGFKFILYRSTQKYYDKMLNSQDLNLIFVSFYAQLPILIEIVFYEKFEGISFLQQIVQN